MSSDKLKSQKAISLTSAEVEQYRDQGYCGPFKLCSPEEMSKIKAEIRKNVLPNNGPMGIVAIDRHVDSRTVYDLCTHPNILDRVSDILGPDLFLWVSEFFDKPPGKVTPENPFYGKSCGETTSIPFHKGNHFFPLEPQVSLSIWIALDKVNVENGCVQVLPGSHKNVYPSLPPFQKIKGYGGRQGKFNLVVDPKYIDSKDLVNMELEAGEFFFFSENVVHASLANRSLHNRLGFTCRMTIPIVKVYHQFRYEGHGVMIVKGQDYMNINQVVEPPDKN